MVNPLDDMTWEQRYWAAYDAFVKMEALYLQAEAANKMEMLKESIATQAWSKLTAWRVRRSEKLNLFPNPQHLQS